MTHKELVTSPDLLGLLRSREAQARSDQHAYPAPVAGPDTMLYWLARAAKELREAAGRKQVHIAAEADKDQSSVYRFEQGTGWPRETDKFVSAYARDLDLEPIQIWQHALAMWQEDRESHAEVAEAVQALEASVAPGARRRRKS